MDNVNKTVKDIQSKAKRLWDENPLVVVVIGIASANAGARLMKANTDRRNGKTYAREIRRRERNDTLR